MTDNQNNAKTQAESGRLRITLIRSAGSKRHAAIVKALGLHRIGQTVEPRDTPSIRGMVRHTAHLVDCVQIDEGGEPS